MGPPKEVVEWKNQLQKSYDTVPLIKIVQFNSSGGWGAAFFVHLFNVITANASEISETHSKQF